ncbi:MAG: S8 family serine peptidase [Thermoproteaceae archaeon]|nr:S8 family serine peptidase [Thermoproteaceae archaeon]
MLRALLAALLAAALLLAQTAASVPMVAIPNTAPKIVHKATPVGPAPPDREITVMVIPKLKMDQLDRYIQELYTPGSPNYGKFLTLQQIYAKFGYGPWEPQLASLIAYARMHGVEVNRTGPFIKLRGKIAQFQQLFQTRFMLYRHKGVVFYAPETDVKLPAAIAPYVGAILGLHNITVARPMVHYIAAVSKEIGQANSQPTACRLCLIFKVLAEIACHICNTTGIPLSHSMTAAYYLKNLMQNPSLWFWIMPPYNYIPLHLHELYSLNPLYRLGLDGFGQNIVIINAYGDPYVGQALAEFDRDMGLPDPPRFIVIYYQATQFPAQGDPDWALEANLDVQWAHAVAPGANIILIYVPYPDESLYMSIADLLYLQSISGMPMIVSLSWGADEDWLIECGIDVSRYEMILAMAAAQGVPVFVASGDWRATFYPATSKYVTAVGGTALFARTAGTELYAAPAYLFETGWDDYIPNATAFGATFKLGWYLGGSGGGVSKLVTKPWYQQQLPYANRTTPDIALVASPLTGVNVYRKEPCPWNATQLCTSVYLWVGGTSLSAPLMAGIYAVIQQGHGARLGFANPYLYGMYFKAQKQQYRAAFNPTQGYATITLGGGMYAWDWPGGPIFTSALVAYLSGNNSGAYAQPWAYNTVTGLGSPNAYYLYQLIRSNGTVLNVWQRTATYAATPTITWPGNITISVWVNIPGNMSGRLVGIASTTGATASANKWSLVKATNDGLAFRIYTSTSTYAECFTTSGIFSKYFGKWVPITVTYNNSTGVARIYINGTLVAICSTFGRYRLDPAPLYIGLAVAPAGVGYFTGYMANLQIYSAELTPAQAAALAIAGTHGPAVSAPLLAWYPMDQTAGSIIYAKTGPAATITGTSYLWTQPPFYPPAPRYTGATHYQFNYTTPVTPK